MYLSKDEKDAKLWILSLSFYELDLIYRILNGQIEFDDASNEHLDKMSKIIFGIRKRICTGQPVPEKTEVEAETA